MATKIKIRKTADILDESAVKNDWTRFVEIVKEKPLLYGACAVFVAVCFAAGLGYRAKEASARRVLYTEYEKAATQEDAKDRAAALEKVAQAKGTLAAEALYMAGESAIEAKDYDKAKEAFERVRNDYSASPYVADAVEGLGFLAENAGHYDQALALYKEIIERWPATLTRRRQEFNVARCQEQLGDLKSAVASYQAQVDQFPQSGAQEAAKGVLQKLRATHPDLFPKPAEPAATTAQPPSTTVPAPEGTAAAPAAAPATPATPAAPATPEPAPAAPAPAPAEGAQPTASQ